MDADPVTDPSPTVLVCEDNLARRTAVSDLLSRAGCSLVGEAETLTELRDLLGANAPDVIVFDLALAGLGGLDVVRDLRVSCPSAEVVVLSDYPSLHDDAVAAGARAHVDVRDLRDLETLLAGLRVPLPRKGSKSIDVVLP